MNTNLTLTPLQLELLDKIRSAAPLVYHPYAYNKREQAAIASLILQGPVYKNITKTFTNGRYTSRVTLSAKA